MPEVRLIKIKEEILSDNRNLAESLRAKMRVQNTLLLNLMSSPGSGKTSLILKTIERIGEKTPIGVIEADLDSTVDADKIAAVGVKAVQIETGGFCHVSAAMCERALEFLDASGMELVIIENVGNLVCPAESDTGAHINVVVLSVPEGDDKPLKYPMIFRAADAVILNKIDYLVIAGFDKDAFWHHVKVLNPKAAKFEISCTTGEGLDAWATWLSEKLIR